MTKFKTFGKYTIFEKISVGGMAEIFLAVDKGTAGVGRFVVLKRTLSQFAEKEEFKDMFRNEGKIACSLKHRNIVPIYEFGIERKQFFLSMEYVSGRNLRQISKKLIRSKKFIDIPQAVYIIKEVASGLNYAHNAIDSNTGEPFHLIHRDVSPQNILISFDGEVKLIDFGIAKVADTDLTQVGHLKGKFGYMSPEQAHGDKLDHRTDIFSLGIILWELLSKQRLFPSKNEMLAIKKVKACDIPDLRDINPSISKDLAHITERALSKNRNGRYETMAEMEKALTVFLNTKYPHFSQYELSAFIRENHEREILNERNQLNNYSKKLKAQERRIASTFNDEHERPVKNQFLSLPDAEEMEDSTNVIKTETHEAHSGYKNLEVTELEEETKESSYSNLKISEEEMKSQSGYTENKEDLGIVKDSNQQLNQLKSMHQTNFSRSTAKTDSSRTDELYEKERTKIMVIALTSIFAFFALIGTVTFAVLHVDRIANSNVVNRLFDKKDNLLKNQAKKKKMKQSKPSSPLQKRKPANSAIKRIFVETKPSGVSLTVNGKLKTFTPTELKIYTDFPLVLTFRKGGYIPKTFRFKKGQQVSSYLKVDLTKEDRDKQFIKIIK